MARTLILAQCSLWFRVSLQRFPCLQTCPKKKRCSLKPGHRGKCDKDRKRLRKEYAGHCSHVMGVDFTANDSRVISVGGNDCSVFVWKHKAANGDTVVLTEKERSAQTKADIDICFKTKLKEEMLQQLEAEGIDPDVNLDALKRAGRQAHGFSAGDGVNMDFGYCNFTGEGVADANQTITEEEKALWAEVRAEKDREFEAAVLAEAAADAAAADAVAAADGTPSQAAAEAEEGEGGPPAEAEAEAAEEHIAVPERLHTYSAGTYVVADVSVNGIAKAASGWGEGKNDPYVRFELLPAGGASGDKPVSRFDTPTKMDVGVDAAWANDELGEGARLAWPGGAPDAAAPPMLRVVVREWNKGNDRDNGEPAELIALSALEDQDFTAEDRRIPLLFDGKDGGAVGFRIEFRAPSGHHRPPSREGLGQARALHANEADDDPDELVFAAGDIITLTERLDENWYQGEFNGRTGLVPVVYVSRIG